MRQNKRILKVAVLIAPGVILEPVIALVALGVGIIPTLSTIQCVRQIS